jgi:signal transduction histidine kinase
MNNTAIKINSIIAHDLKDSLASISGISDILIHNWDDFGNEEKLEILEEIRETSESTMRLLSDLLDWGKKIEKISEPEKKVFNALEVFRMVINHAKPYLKRKSVVITNKISEPVILWGDENMFAAVIRNLLANAIRSCVNGGFIEIGASGSDNEFVFYIADNGIGMTKSQIDQLFPVSGQPSDHSVSLGYSNGFGLILCRDFLRINNGDLWAESREGKGSKVFFTFPLFSPEK